MHPLIPQAYVGFGEAEVQPLADGTAHVTFHLTCQAHKQFQEVQVHWRRIDPYFLTSARIVIQGPPLCHGVNEDSVTGTRVLTTTTEDSGP
jgi:hypothetical protein